jgi:hypothetical protein
MPSGEQSLMAKMAIVSPVLCFRTTKTACLSHLPIDFVCDRGRG